MVNIGTAVAAGQVAHRNVVHFQIQLRRAEEQVKIAERVEVAEIGPIGGDLPVIFPGERLGAAERILDLGVEQVRYHC